MKPILPQSSEHQIQQAILQYLKVRGIFAWRNNTIGVWDSKLGIYRKNTTIKGVSDILGILPTGRFLAIEVKRKGGIVSDEQLEFNYTINKNGGLAFVAYSIDDVIFHLNNN